MDKVIDQNKDKDVINDKVAADINRRAKYNDEGDEAIADFTYDMLFNKKDNYKDLYSDYED